ncbi:HD-GYP domain-containing protein [Granulosicoccus antarcticus]|uniref:HD-GYP domain-containing protein n=1 Tax=Granulosicoccus antarcticus TaxID=437505 RepID=UPI00146FAF89|nr:HD-GYP domain-containing protein [Granulosicoccus antarcticus]
MSKPVRERTQRSRKLHEKMDVKDLRVGMFVVELDKPWEESGFMFQGVELKSPSDVLAVQKECKFVWVDYDEFSLQSNDTVSAGLSTPGAGSILDKELQMEEELDAATEVHTLASQAISTLFEEIRLGAELDGTKVKQAVNGCVDSILRNPDASVWLTRIQAKNQATAQHSLNVAALSIVIAKSMSMTNRELEDVGVCGMLHDVGKTSVSDEVLNKVGPLDEAQWAEMRKHTRYGRDILLSTKTVMSGAADVAHSHHERPDGSGYPRKLDDDSIPLYAKIVSIAEAYDTMTVNQPYRPAFSPSDAIQELYAKRGKQFDEELVIHFIDAIGIFPPGSIVEMFNGEVGIVLSNTSDKLRPRVIMILDALGEPAAQRIVDLSQMDTDNEGNIYQIKTTHCDGAYGIDVGDFQRAGLRVG